MGEDNNEIWINEETTKRKKRKSIIVFAIIGLLLVVSGILYYAIDKKIDSYANKIYPGVTVNGVDVGNKTKGEAKGLIEVELLEQVKDKTIKLVAREKSIVIEYDKINPEYKIDAALDKALAVGKSEKIFKKFVYITKGIKENIKVEFGYDKKIVDDYISNLNEEVTIPAKNATLDIDNGEIKIISAKNGLELDVEKLKTILDEKINCDINIMDDVIEVPVREQLPKVTDELISEIDGKLSTSTTSFNNGDWGRTQNLKVATGYISGTVLMPGETFSYNDTVGERRTDRGFKPGAAFSGDEVVQTIGGGVCQISTTLYQAIMKAGIPSVERTNHSMKVTYAAPSEDSTVAWGYLDYKFKNIYDSPIYIEGVMGVNTVTFNIYGDKSEMGNKTYDLVGATTGTYNGVLSSIGYLITYEDGKQVSKEVVSRDNYK